MKAFRFLLALFPASTLLFGIADSGQFCLAGDLARAKALFKNPPRQYSSGPLWVWNDMLTEQQVRDTLRDMAAQKVKQVWVHPRPGLMTPYLSQDWFRLWKVALAEAERLDMNVWIYDENSYPSGFAGGWVPELMPESRGRGLVLREAKSPPKWSDDLIGIYRLADTGCENLTVKLKAGEALPEGNYLVATEVRAGNSPWNGNRCYVNLLSPGVTEKFLDITMERYRKEIGNQFGRRVPGVFTDEPNIRPAGDWPWSEILAQEFQKRWGYSLLDNLPSLARPVGEWRKVRHNYFQVLNEQFIEHWARPNHDYCASNHLEWTGHYWDHDWPDCIGVPDNMAMYAWHQRPSIDCLMNQYAEHTHAQFGNLRMVRELASVANQLGASRTLCEAYGAGGWDLRFEDMKRIGDWLEVLGVNTLNQHLSYVTLRGARKRDHPQSFSYHEPWWSAYHVSAEYFARVSEALSQGEQINRILVLEPTTTAWMYQRDGAQLQKLGDSFFNLLKALESAQVEYDIASEDILARHGSVDLTTEMRSTTRAKSATISALPEGPSLRVGARSYSRIIIPPFTENLNVQTVALLEKLLRARGSAQVLCADEPPTRVDGALSDRPSDLAKGASWKHVSPAELPDQLKPSGADGFTMFREPGDKGILFHHRRQLSDCQLLFLVNTSLESPSSGAIESDFRGVQQWNLYTGDIEPYPFAKTGAGVKASFRLPPSGSLLLCLSAKSQKPVPAKEEIVRTIQPESSPEIVRLQPNVLTLDYVNARAGTESRTNLYIYQANQFAWQKNGMDRNPWDSAVQFKEELISKTFPAGSGFEADYKFRIEDAVPRDLTFVLERPDLYTVSCNGQPVTAKPGAWWLDKAFGQLDISSAARTGENLVTIKASPFTMYHELEPAYLLGDFTLRPVESGFVVAPDRPLKLGRTRQEAWNAQGLPFYSGGVAYRERFELTERKGRYLLTVPNWYGSVASVTVNGKRAGYIDAPPWQCDVTRLLKRGPNNIEVTVIGTLKNTLGPHHGNPAPGAAWPGGFQHGPNPGPPPGAQYSTFAYGMFEPFVLNQVLEQ